MPTRNCANGSIVTNGDAALQQHDSRRRDARQHVAYLGGTDAGAVELRQPLRDVGGNGAVRAWRRACRSQTARPIAATSACDDGKRPRRRRAIVSRGRVDSGIARRRPRNETARPLDVPAIGSPCIRARCASSLRALTFISTTWMTATTSIGGVGSTIAVAIIIAMLNA